MPLKILLTLIFTFFLDNVGLFMVVPIYAPLLLHPDNTILPVTTSEFWRTLLIGLLIATYGVGQFLGGPLLGELSDQFGRKKVLMVGLVFLIIGNVLGFIGLLADELFLLFICRFLTGFASGNWSVMFAAVTDATHNAKQRNTYLGYLTGAAALGAVAGPFIGAHFSQPSALFPFLNYATPFLVMVFLFILNLFLLMTMFQDGGQYTRRKLSIWISLTSMIDCFKMPVIRVMLIVFFFFSISSESIFAGLPIYAVDHFNVNSIFIGNVIILGSIISALTSIYFNKILSQTLSSKYIFLVSLFFLCLAYASFFIPYPATGLFFSYGLFGLTVILVWTHANSLIIQLTNDTNQGKVLGVNQSLCSLAIIVGPLLIGLFGAAHDTVPILISVISSVIALLIFLVFLAKNV